MVRFGGVEYQSGGPEWRVLSKREESHNLWSLQYSMEGARFFNWDGIMTEMKHEGGQAFDSASMGRNEFASLQALTADRDAYMERGVQLARKALVQVVAVDEDENGAPLGLYTCQIEDSGTQEEWERGDACIENLKGLKAELVKAFKVQDDIWELKDQVWLRNSDRADRYPADWHFADRSARQLLVAVHVYLNLNDEERTDTTTDFAESMMAWDNEDPTAEGLYEDIAAQSVKLMRQCLTQFIKVYDEHRKTEQGPSPD